MGLVLNPSKVESCDNSSKSKGRKKKDDAVEETGCWVKLRFGTCMPSRSKVDSSITGTSVSYAETKSSNEKSRDRELTRGGSSTTTSNAGSTTSTPYFSEELKVASQLRKFTFNELKLATRNFRPESLLGEGGFGCVFKGWVEENGTAPVKPGTGLTVAVKTLNHDGLQGHKEWLAEIYFLGDLVHPNLVKLIGYSIEDDQRLLVYEFLPRGSLENHLFRRSLPLPWSIRMRIALGAAKGLAFLHEEVQKPVIYRDFKTSNILLDADYNAKLSDFGLAKDGPEGDKTHVSTRVMGTYGYAAPEYVMTDLRSSQILVSRSVKMATEQLFPEVVAQDNSIGQDKCSFEKWNTVSDGVADSDNKSCGTFDCSICLDSVQDPVVTLCGHLYCWPCIYKWLQFQSPSSENQDEQKQPQCPVCKAEVSESSLVPLYGRGQTTKPPKPSKGKAPHLGIVIPRRPFRPCGADTPRSARTPTSQYVTPQLHHRSSPYGSQLNSPLQDPMNSPGVATTAINPGADMFGEMVYARVFGNSLTNLYTNSNSYNLAGSGSPRVRRHVMQADKSLSRICFFLFCCFMLCLVLF